MSQKQNFDKPGLSLDEKIKLLQSRWLIIDDEEKAKHDLLHIWYFRLTWYFKFYQDKQTNIFKEWTTFKQVVDLYSFDRKLRLLTLDAIEKIEVSLKSNINYTLYNDYWFYWYLDKNLFNLENEKNLEIYNNLVLKIKSIQEKSSAIFVKEFFRKYSDEFLPSHMLFEELTIWELSNSYRLLKTEFKQKISDNFWVYQLDLQIWIQLLVNIRNICAHHSRLWNKEYIVKLRLRDKTFWDKFLLWEIKNFNTPEVLPNYYNATLIINYLLKHINKNFSWLADLEKLFSDFELIDKTKMWFNKNWKNNFEI